MLYQSRRGAEEGVQLRREAEELSGVFCHCQVAKLGAQQAPLCDAVRPVFWNWTTAAAATSIFRGCQRAIMS